MSRELNIRVYKALGREPKLLKIASIDNGLSAAITETSFYSSRDTIEDWIKDHPSYKLCHWKQYVPYSTDLELAFELLDRFDGKCIKLTRLMYGSEGKWGWECLINIDNPPYGTGDTLPKAICEAVIMDAEAKK